MASANLEESSGNGDVLSVTDPEQMGAYAFRLIICGSFPDGAGVLLFGRNINRAAVICGGTIVGGRRIGFRWVFF